MLNVIKLLLLRGRGGGSSMPDAPNTEFLSVGLAPSVTVGKIEYIDGFGEEQIIAGITDINISVSSA